MSVILILILASLAVAILFLCGFIWAVRSGQFEDTCTPSMRILTDEAAVTGTTQGGDQATQSKPCPAFIPHSANSRTLNSQL